jgi:cytochrome c553
MRRHGLVGLALLFIIGSGACGFPVNQDDRIDAGDPVERGRYIVDHMAICTFCHTPLLPNGTRDTTNFLAGWECFVPAGAFPGAGCLNTRNLTNDPTGLMNATDEQIMDAFQNGHRTDGKGMVPVMPYAIFHNMSRDDARALVAFLRTVPGVHHQVPANGAFFSNWNDGVPGFAVATPVDPGTIPFPIGITDFASAQRGRYKASSIALCMECHTPINTTFTPRLQDMTKPFAGDNVLPFSPEQLGLINSGSFMWPAAIFSANLTSDATGLAGWTHDDVMNVLKKGVDRMGHKVCAATHGDVNSPYAGLTDEDANDIANYILALPPINNPRPMDCVGP